MRLKINKGIERKGAMEQTYLNDALKSNDMLIAGVVHRCETVRRKEFPDLPKGIYLLNPLMSSESPGSFQPINSVHKRYAIRLQSKFYYGNSKKVNNLVKQLFIQTRLWLNGVDWKSNDAIKKEIMASKMSGLIAKVKGRGRRRLYCPECYKNGRINYTMVTNVKPRYEFCPYCDKLILFKTKKRGLK